MLLLCSISTWGQDGFNPADPPEPEQPAMKLNLVVYPSEAGSASGSGRYAPGKVVTLRAYGNTGFRFVKWTNADGETVSTSQEFNYTKGEGHEVLTANFEFDPDAPADPAEPSTIMYFKLTLNATEGGSVSGGGSYLAGKTVTLRAYNDSGFDFDGWYDADGNRLSTSASYNYTTTAKHTMLTGRFSFNPDNPSEPTDPGLKPKHNITATATEGGSVEWTLKRLQEGQSVTFRAYTNSGYTFDGWYLNGELYTKLEVFSYTVTSETVQDFEARFEFNPDSPGEPGMAVVNRHSFYLMNAVTKPGAVVKFPLYLSSIKTLKDMTFQLEFPEELTPDFTSVDMSEKAVGYSVSFTKQDAKNYVFTLTGGSVPAGNSALLVFTVNVAQDIATGLDYPVKINQVVVVEDDDTEVTASTRNGRFSVYLNGDANGDNSVSITDAVTVVNHILGNPTDEFIEVAANTNDDEDISISDVVGVVNIILDDDTPAAPQLKPEYNGTEPD